MIHFDDRNMPVRRNRGQDLPPLPADAPNDAAEERAQNLWKLLSEGTLKGHKLRVGNTLRRGGQRGGAGSDAEFEFVEGQTPVSTGTGRRRSNFDPRRYNLKIVADAMRGAKARAIALDNLRYVMDETTGTMYLPWATAKGEVRSHNTIPRELRSYAKDALYTTSGGNTGVRHFFPPGYGPLDDESAPASRQPKEPVSELRGPRGRKRLQDWWAAGGGTPGVTARLKDFAEPFAARVAFGEAEEKQSLFITFNLPDHIAEKYPKGSRGAASAAAGGESVKPADKAKPHVTVLYCGKQTAATAEKARKAVVEVMKDQEDFDIQGSGVDYFSGCEDEGKTDAVYTPITGGVTKLTALRENLAKALREAGVEWKDTHPEYKPHVTIKYVPKGDADTVDALEPWTAWLRCVHVNHGDSKRVAYCKQSYVVPFSEQHFGIRSIPPTASAYLDRLRQWQTPGGEVEPPDMPERERIPDWLNDKNPAMQGLGSSTRVSHGSGTGGRGFVPSRGLRVSHGGLDYDPSEMSDRVPTDEEKRQIVGPNVMDMRLAHLRGVSPRRRSALQDYELERMANGMPAPAELERHSLRYPNFPPHQETRVNVPGSDGDLRTRLLEMELNDPSVPHRQLDADRRSWGAYPDSIIMEGAASRHAGDVSNAIVNAQPDNLEEIAERLYDRYGGRYTPYRSPMHAPLRDAAIRNIARHRFSRGQQFDRENPPHPMIQQAIDRSVMRPRRGMPPPIGHPRSPVELTGEGHAVLRSASQNLAPTQGGGFDPEAFDPFSHVITGDIPLPRRHPSFMPRREARFNPDMAHADVIRSIMGGRLPRRRYQGNPNEPLVVRANDEWNSDPTTFERPQQEFGNDPARRRWVTPSLFPQQKPQAPQQPVAPQPSAFPTPPQVPTQPKPQTGPMRLSGRENAVYGGTLPGTQRANRDAAPMFDPNSEAFRPRQQSPEAKWGTIKADEASKSLEGAIYNPRRGDIDVDGGNWHRGTPMIEAERVSMPSSRSTRPSWLAGAAKGAKIGGRSLGAGLSDLGWGIAGTLLGLGTGDLGTAGLGLFGMGRGALRAGTSPLGAGVGGYLGARGYDPRGILRGDHGGNRWNYDNEDWRSDNAEDYYQRLGEQEEPERPRTMSHAEREVMRRRQAAGFSRNQHEFAAPQQPLRDPITDWIQALRGTGQPRPQPQQAPQRPPIRRPAYNPEQTWPRVMPFQQQQEFAAPGGAPSRVMFPSDDGRARPGQYANAGLQSQQMRSVFGPQSRLQTTHPPFTQLAQQGKTVLVGPTGAVLGALTPANTVPVQPAQLQPIRPQPTTGWEQPKRFSRSQQEFSILRPDETGAGRGLGSQYPRIAPRKPYESGVGVEYDPREIPIDAKELAFRLKYNMGPHRNGWGGNRYGIEGHTQLGRYAIEDLNRATAGDDASMILERVVNRNRIPDMDRGSASQNLTTTRQLRDHLKGMSGVRETDPLSLAGIRRQNRPQQPFASGVADRYSSCVPPMPTMRTPAAQRFPFMRGQGFGRSEPSQDELLNFKRLNRRWIRMKGGGLARIDASPERGEVGERERGIFVTSPEHGQIGKGWLNIDHDRSAGVNGDDIAALHPFVKPEFRRKGIGTAMYQRAAELSRGRAVEPTSQPSDAANQLWESLNWRIDPKRGRQFSRQDHAFSIGAAEASATTLNHFHPAFRRSSKRRTWNVA